MSAKWGLKKNLGLKVSSKGTLIKRANLKFWEAKLNLQWFGGRTFIFSVEASIVVSKDRGRVEKDMQTI